MDAMDEINLEIIKHLKDGRKSFAEIAKELNLTENTVRSRTKKLQDSGILDISGLVDSKEIPNHVIGYIGVNLKTMELVKKAEEISKLRGVISVAVVTGRYDLMLTVMLNEDFNLLAFYTQEMTKVKDVLSTETFVAYTGFNLKVPYVL